MAEALAVVLDPPDALVRANGEDSPIRFNAHWEYLPQLYRKE
jgi:hypothetical protein